MCARMCVCVSDEILNPQAVTVTCNIFLVANL